MLCILSALKKLGDIFQPTTLKTQFIFLRPPYLFRGDTKNSISKWFWSSPCSEHLRDQRSTHLKPSLDSLLLAGGGRSNNNPIGSMGLVYLPAFTIKINQM